jgi:hypothetical protein
MDILPAAVVFRTHWTAARFPIDFRPGGDAMSKMIEVPEELFERLERAAAAEGLTPVAWLDARLRVLRGSRHAGANENAGTVSDRLAGLVGVVASGGQERLSERHSEVFGEMLEEQRRTGRL